MVINCSLLTYTHTHAHYSWSSTNVYIRRVTIKNYFTRLVYVYAYIYIYTHILKRDE